MTNDSNVPQEVKDFILGAFKDTEPSVEDKSNVVPTCPLQVPPAIDTYIQMECLKLVVEIINLAGGIQKWVSYSYEEQVQIVDDIFDTVPLFVKRFKLIENKV